MHVGVVPFSQAHRIKEHVRRAYDWQTRAQQQVTISAGVVGGVTLLWNAAVQRSIHTTNATNRQAEAKPALLYNENEQLSCSTCYTRNSWQDVDNCGATMRNSAEQSILEGLAQEVSSICVFMGEELAVIRFIQVLKWAKRVREAMSVKFTTS
eukprot:17981-Heterococcus_DN1.PRE.1